MLCNDRSRFNAGEGRSSCRRSGSRTERFETASGKCDMDKTA